MSLFQFNIGGIRSYTTVIIFLGHQDITIISPMRRPWIFHQPIIFTIKCTITYCKYCMVQRVWSVSLWKKNKKNMIEQFILSDINWHGFNQFYPMYLPKVDKQSGTWANDLPSLLLFIFVKINTINKKSWKGSKDLWGSQT